MRFFDKPAPVGTSRRTTLEASVLALRVKRAASVYMEERVRLSVEIHLVERDLCAAIGRGER
jgi:hypothetical protein